jgi:hypothetical protein
MVASKGSILDTSDRKEDVVRRPTSRRSYGVAGGSVRATVSGWRGWWLRSSWRSRLAVLATLTMVGTVASVVAGLHPVTAVLVSAGIVSVIAAGLAAPDALLVTAVSLVFLLIMAPLAVTYETGFFTVSADTQSAILGMFFSYLIAVVIGVRWSRGRRWVTMALTAGSTIVPGLFLLILVPPLGLNAARISMAIVLLLRCGGWAWLSGTFGLLTDSLTKRDVRNEGLENVEIPAETAPMQEWARRAHAEQETAQLLSQLDSDYATFHDVDISGATGAVSHIVVGPGGGFIIASLQVSELPTGKIDVPLDDVRAAAAALLDHQEPVARAMKTAASDIQLLIVIHGSKTQRKAFALYQEGKQTPEERVLVVSPDNLIAEVAPGYVVWGTVKVSRLTRQLRMRARAAAAAQPVRWPDAPHLSPVDSDGNAQPPQYIAPPATEIAWMTRGAPCRVITTLGVLTNLRIAKEPYTTATGMCAVNVCRDDEWRAAMKYGNEPEAYPYPVDSVAQHIPTTA